MHFIQGAILIEENCESVAECLKKFPGIQIQYVNGHIYLGDCAECGEPVIEHEEVINRWLAKVGYLHENCMKKFKEHKNESSDSA